MSMKDSGGKSLFWHKGESSRSSYQYIFIMPRRLLMSAVVLNILKELEYLTPLKGKYWILETVFWGE